MANNQILNKKSVEHMTNILQDLNCANQLSADQIMKYYKLTDDQRIKFCDHMNKGTMKDRFLANERCIAELIEDVRGFPLLKVTMQKKEITDKLTDIAAGTVFDVVRMENGRVMLKDLEDIEEHHRANVKSIKMSRWGIEVHFHDTLAAMKQLAELCGYNAPQQVENIEPKPLSDFYKEVAEVKQETIKH